MKIKAVVIRSGMNMNKNKYYVNKLSLPQLCETLKGKSVNINFDPTKIVGKVIDSKIIDDGTALEATCQIDKEELKKNKIDIRDLFGAIGYQFSYESREVGLCEKTSFKNPKLKIIKNNGKKDLT